MERNRIIKNSIWLAVMVTSLLLLILCAALAVQEGCFGGGNFAKEVPHEAVILTEQCLSFF